MSYSKKIEKIVEHLINKQFEVAGHQVTFEDILDKERWYVKYEMTCEQASEFRKYAYNYIKKKLYLNKIQAERELNWFCLQYGLKLVDPENIKSIK